MGKTVWQGKLLAVKVEDVRLASGRTSAREVVEHPGAVALVPLTGAGQVLLVEQYRAGAGESLLELPAGTLAPGEAPEDCARRELEEETGHRAARLERLAGFYTSPGYSSEFMHVFLATGLEPAPGRPEDDEEIELRRLGLEEALALAREGRLRDAKSVAGLLLAGCRLGRG